MEAVLAGDLEEARQILTRGDIPVMVDERAMCGRPSARTYSSTPLSPRKIRGQRSRMRLLSSGQDRDLQRGRTATVSSRQRGDTPWQTDLGGDSYSQHRCARQCGRLHHRAASAGCRGGTDRAYSVHRQSGGEGADRGLHRGRACLCGHVRYCAGYAPGGSRGEKGHEDRRYRCPV